MKEYKIAIMGAAGVGKTSIINQFIKGYFCEWYDPVIEDSHLKTIIHKGGECIVDIYDACGMYQFPRMMDDYVINSDGYILVYSAVDHSTFEAIKTTRAYITSFKGTEQVPIVLVGNKGDLAFGSRAVETSMAAELAATWPNCRFIEKTARNHDEIESVFAQCLDAIKESKSGKCSVM